jgi:antibiotic biosynthesis monooxygenase (ABM) superfamily enzyme
MTLSWPQRIWMVGVTLYLAWLLGDILDLYDVPPIYMLAGLAPFLLTWWVMPSLAALSGRRRRG